MDFQHPPLERECWFVPTVTKLRIGAQKPFTFFAKCCTFFAIMGFWRVFCVGNGEFLMGYLWGRRWCWRKDF